MRTSSGHPKEGLENGLDLLVLSMEIELSQYFRGMDQASNLIQTRELRAKVDDRSPARDATAPVTQTQKLT